VAKLVTRWNVCLQNLSDAVSARLSTPQGDDRAMLECFPSDSCSDTLQEHSDHLQGTKQLTADLIEKTNSIKANIQRLQGEVANWGQKYSNELILQQQYLGAPKTPASSLAPADRIGLEHPTPTPYAVDIPLHPVTPSQTPAPTSQWSEQRSQDRRIHDVRLSVQKEVHRAAHTGGQRPPAQQEEEDEEVSFKQPSTHKVPVAAAPITPKVAAAREPKKLASVPKKSFEVFADASNAHGRTARTSTKDSIMGAVATDIVGVALGETEDLDFQFVMSPMRSISDDCFKSRPKLAQTPVNAMPKARGRT